MHIKITKLLTSVFTKIVTVSLILIGLSGCVVGNQVGHSGKDVYGTFGNIDVFDGQRAGDLENNSGNITIGKNAIVKSVDITNGNIEIGEFSEASSLETVNGNINVAKNVSIQGNIKTINGNIDINQAVNLGANVIGSNGDITLGQNTVVQGDIIFEKSLLSSYTDKTPTLTLAEGTTIKGKIHLYRYVNVETTDSISRDKIVLHYQDNK